MSKAYKLYRDYLPTSWVVIIGLSLARVFRDDKQNHELHLIKDLLNPLARERDRDLRRHKPGWGRSRYMRAQAPHALSREKTPHDDVMEQFALEIYHYLLVQWHQNKFDELKIYAPPKLLGLIKKSFSKKFLAVSTFVPRDLEKAPLKKLEERMHARP
jgi:protein required for attachment to host cells